MEDQIGEVESIETKIPSVKGKSHHPKYLTITVMRSVGKIRSFKISRRLVFWSTIFFVTYIITSTYFINDWVDKRRIKNDHSEKIKRLETDLLKSKKERLKSKQRLALLEDYIRNIEE